MFLTQPPQKSIRFGIRYEYNPGKRTYFSVEKDGGVRFEDLVEWLEKEPELKGRAVTPGSGYHQ